MDKVVCFGCGIEGRKLYNLLGKNQIDFFCDNAFRAKSLFGIAVYKPSVEVLKNRKIIITPIDYYVEIKKQLESYSLEENIDFFSTKNYLELIKYKRKKVRVYFIGFWDGFDINNNFFIDILKQRYDVVIEENNPDYVFCSMFGKPYEYLKYDGIRIFYSGENISPDFNYVDYAVGYNRGLEYEDRFCRWFYFLRKRKQVEIDIEKKDKFCNFIYSHERDDDLRRRIFEELSKYKRVDALGVYLKNVSDETVSMSNKVEKTKNYKFSLAIESVTSNDFMTEKIQDAFMAYTIPIYLGGAIEDIYNKEAYIDCRDYPTIEEIVKRIIQIDKDNDLYLEMLRKEMFNKSFDLEKHHQDFADFLFNIFEQDKSAAYRRMKGPQKYVTGVLYKQEEILKSISSFSKDCIK